MASFSFDIVSEIDLQEMTNAVDQAQRELVNRYDLRGLDVEILYDKSIPSLTLVAPDEMALEKLNDVLLTKLIKRGIPPKSLDYGKAEISGKTLRQVISIQQGLSKEQAKQVNQTIKQLKIKVQPQVDGEQIRVSGKSKDDLQAVMQELKSKDFDFALQFKNFR